MFPLVSRSNNVGFADGIHAKWHTPEQMMGLQFLFKSTAWPAPTEPLGGGEDWVEGPSVEATGEVDAALSMVEAFPFLEVTGKADLNELCRRCRKLACGADTVRGLSCVGLGVAVDSRTGRVL